MFYETSIWTFQFNICLEWNKKHPQSKPSENSKFIKTAVEKEFLIYNLSTDTDEYKANYETDSVSSVWSDDEREFKKDLELQRSNMIYIENHNLH